VHLTVLDGFRALDAGALRLDLDGPATLHAESDKPLRPGIFELKFKPPSAGTYRGRLAVTGTVAGVIADIEIHVHAEGHVHADEVEHAKPEEPTDHEHADHAHDERQHDHGKHEPGHTIELLKEQQWGVPFATAWAREGTLISSIEVPGAVTTPPGGSAEVGAPVAGRLVPPTEGLPRPGDAVTKGQLLAMLAPAPSSPEASARANLAVSEHARVAELTALLDAHDAQQSPPLWPSLLEGAIRIDPPLGAPRSPDDEFVYWAN